MANVLIEEISMQDIGNAIREKNGTTDTYTPSEMGDAIRAIESGGSGSDDFDAFIEGTLTEVSSDAETIGGCVFSGYNLTTVNFPECVTIGSSAFQNCKGLTEVSFPKCTTICEYAFNYCSRVKHIYCFCY